MSRKVNYITRTVESTTATVLKVDLSTTTVDTITVEIPEKIESCTAALNWINKNAPAPIGCVYAAVTAVDVSETLYGITLEKFIENAVELNPQTRRPYGETETERVK